MEDARRHYLDLIRQDGVRLSPPLARAFAAVPREVFVPDGFHRRDGSRVLPADPEFLRSVYSNDVLVTKLNGRQPISSSSQPSLMAIMLEALDVRPGQRVLEIGAGTGYNAALLATLGAEVTTVDVQEDVADRARAALARAEITGVRVEAADGYTGGPAGRYDRIIVTVGVAGISPFWIERLLPGGRVIAPVEHAGMHPVLAADPSGAVSVICPAGFMSAAGPLGARHDGSHPPPPAGPLTGLDPAAPARWGAPLEALAYRDLWFAAGAWHRRVTYASVPGREQSLLAVLSGGDRYAAVVLPDGEVLASSDHCAAVALALSDRWWSLGRPPMSAWRATLAQAGPLLVPRAWKLGL
ncbi:methyltransferase domain-containing protein [Actinoplanes sp. NPDC023714]|uniref:protein-L-isoaspartate O-methyltransferase family protein n=1 Tax=Actinoplanes sp. NPDC023714 TaxID=3154322 RepID=UPI0033D20E26